MAGPGAETSSPFADKEAGNPPWEAATSRILIVRLSPFRDVDRSATHSFLFREARSASSDAYIDFSFFPLSSERAALDAQGLPWMRGIASGKCGADFDVLLVSNSFALELLNLIPFLERSGIPAFSTLRSGPGRSFPVIIMGGSNALAAQAAGHPDNAIVDALFFGEAEGMIPAVLAAAVPGPGKTKKDGIDALTRIEGIWTCDASRTALKSVSRDFAFPGTPPPLFDSFEADTVKLEISRGCPSFCSFCFEGRERKPYREHDVDALTREATRLRMETGAETVELLSFNFNAHSRIVELVQELNRVFDHVNFMSQRVDLLANTPGLTDYEFAAGKNSFTLGIEGISARMRRFYRKELPENDIDTVIKSLRDSKAKEIKLFYILSGRENVEDLAEFGVFCARLGAPGKERSSSRFLFSFGWLVRMPFTPLRYEPLILERQGWRRLEESIRKTVESNGFEFRTPGHFDEYVISQLLVSLDGAYGLDLLQAASKAGIIYDGTLPKKSSSFADSWMADHRGIVDAIAGKKDLSHPFPLSDVLPSLGNEVLFDDYADAESDIERKSCFESKCSGCGACLDEEREAIVSHRIKPASRKDIETVGAILLGKQKAKTVYARVTIPGFLASVHPHAVNAWITRDILGQFPGETGNLLSVHDALFLKEGSRDRFPVCSGTTVFAFRAYDTGRFLEKTKLEEFPVWKGTFKEIKATLTLNDADRSIKTFDNFLSSRQLTHVKSKAEGGYRYEMSLKALKKGEILSAKLVKTSATIVIELSLGCKADLRELFKTGGTESVPSFEIKEIDIM